jgi:adenosine/AMP kinase
LILLGQNTGNDDEIKKCRLVENAQNIGLVATVFEKLLSDKFIIEIFNFLRFPPEILMILHLEVKK